MKKEKMDSCCCERSDFVRIAASVCGIYLVIVIVMIIFASEKAEILIPIAWTFLMIAFFACLFSYLSRKKDIKK